VSDVNLAQLRIELGCLSKRPVTRSAQDCRNRNRVQMQADAEDQRCDYQPVQDRKPPFGASK